MKEPICDANPYPLVKPGVYEAECHGYCLYPDPQFKREVCMLKFRLILEGIEVVHYLNLGEVEKPHVGRRSNYRHAWIIATGHQPRKGQVMSPRVFTHKLYMVEVGSPARRWDRTEHSPGEQYSVVRRIIRKTMEQSESVNQNISQSNNQGRHGKVAEGSDGCEYSDT